MTEDMRRMIGRGMYYGPMVAAALWLIHLAGWTVVEFFLAIAVIGAWYFVAIRLLLTKRGGRSDD